MADAPLSLASPGRIFVHTTFGSDTLRRSALRFALRVARILVTSSVLAAAMVLSR
ncbi:hypothetical protein [Nocardia bovistercoris]|uniref:Uncharacterized protein n=1 Tax=Nocardia bovistercoris TaxID=2785916 RepID=A0A931N2B6_9NOCA|nr:hypothetical protein [Nocardia bovistercoris]MBH0775866.1 hypothetical protein [Nocardia bovistercoris]